ncbi:hypothetical protein AKJ63_00075 [candidate division MSBL1 archaeon SCGC-AAA259D18]|uniref:Arginine--tRNA ligase n=1 Tax=candidate division MSBL1 archaeon SCGC-AAA259D18 TaxID=1698262 RepID=A0A133UCV5_9EURY|nr:hypothetical protein AKJ63_00075 [candidate division MSBL1 archaeon SCGC-AAA259D18]
MNVLNLAFEELDWPEEGLNESLEDPPDPSLGDLASTICFELPSELQEPPQELAERLAEKIEPQGLVERVEAEGGYVNFFADLPELSSVTLDSVEKYGGKFGHRESDGRKVVIEHTSVNPTKPLHIGHGRNAIIGDTMARILKALGHEVEVQNYIDDLGLQVAQTLVAYRSEENVSEEKFDHFLGGLYVDFHERVESEPELEEEAREVLSRIEEGEGELAQEARQMSSLCVESNLETTDRLNVDYDLLIWESDISRSGMLEEALNSLRETPYLTEGEDEKEGAMVLRLEEFGLEDKILIRSDGTPVYTARDIAYQLWKFGRVEGDLQYQLHSRRPDGMETFTTVPEGGDSDHDFADADQAINVIGMEQRYPQKVVFSALRALGLEDEYENSYHMAYEHVRLPSKKFEGRRGTWIGYSVDDVLDEAVSRAREEVEKRNPDAGSEFVRKAAEMVGIGAVRYSLISSSPEKEIVFKWDEALNFEQNSGPAIQYSHARASSILRKAEEEPQEHPHDILKKEEERELVKKLAKFPETVREAGENLQTHRVAVYASELALLFNKFYEVAPVIQAKTDELRSARLRLVKAAKTVLENSLQLLGIEAPERM